MKSYVAWHRCGHLGPVLTSVNNDKREKESFLWEDDKKRKAQGDYLKTYFASPSSSLLRFARLAFSHFFFPVRDRTYALAPLTCGFIDDFRWGHKRGHMKRGLPSLALESSLKIPNPGNLNVNWGLGYVKGRLFSLWAFNWSEENSSDTYRDMIGNGEDLKNLSVLPCLLQLVYFSYFSKKPNLLTIQLSRVHCKRTKIRSNSG